MKISRQSKNKQSTGKSKWELRLYVAGQLSHSAGAITNLEQLCDGLDATVEVVDVLEDPARALEDGIVATPTVVRLSPEPKIRIFGTLSDLDRVRLALGLPTRPLA